MENSTLMMTFEISKPKCLDLTQIIIMELVVIRKLIEKLVVVSVNLAQLSSALLLKLR